MAVLCTSVKHSAESDARWADRQDCLSDYSLAQLPVDLTASLSGEVVPTPARGMDSSSTPVGVSNRWLALVEEVRATQRKSFARRERWHAYCDEHLGGTRDPSWHSCEALRAFLDLLAARPALSTQDEGAHADLVAKVKAIQKHSSQGTAVWRSYCDTSLNGQQSQPDPALHIPAFPKAFLDKVWTVAKQPKAAEPTGKTQKIEYKGKHYSAEGRLAAVPPLECWAAVLCFVHKASVVSCF